MTENTTYDQLKTQRHLSLEWRGINSTQICFEKSYFSLKKDHVYLGTGSLTKRRVYGYR